MFGYLRFFLAMLVVVSHVGYKCGVLHAGVAAVAVFYMLAGYVVANLFTTVFQPGPTRIRRFYLERLLRILPQYLFILTLTVVFILVTGFGQPLFSVGRVLANLLIVPLNYNMIWDFSIMQNPKWWLIPPAWSLGLELQAYLLLPLILLSRKGKVVLSLFSLAVFGLANAGILSTEDYGYRLLPGVLMVFVLGTCVYRTARDPQHADWFDRLFPPVCWVLFLIGAAGMGMLDQLRRGQADEVYAGLLLGMPAVMYCANARMRLPLDRLMGDLSYGIFLSHFLGIFMIQHLAPEFPLRSISGLAAVTAIALGIALAGVVLIERPLFNTRKLLAREPGSPKIPAPSVAVPPRPPGGRGLPIQRFWTEWQRWYALRGSVQNWVASWRVAASRLAQANPHRHGDPQVPERVHAVQMRSGLVLNFAVAQWTVMPELLRTSDLYLANLQLELRPGDVVVDIGAHIGTFSVPIAFRHPGVNVIACEPDPHNANLLERNAAANGLIQPRLRICRQAVDGVAGRQAFLQGRTSTTGTLASAGYVKNRAFSPQPLGDVVTVTLEQLFETHRVARCRLLKLDCEGSEYAIFNNTPDPIFDRIDAIILEGHPLPSHQPSELLPQLERLGFQVTSHTHRNGCREFFAQKPGREH